MSAPPVETFAYIGDVHLRLTTPRARQDAYYVTACQILEQALTAAREQGAIAIVFGGDLGHKSAWDLRLFMEVGDLLRNSGLPIYSIVGNHDIRGYNLDTIAWSGLGALEWWGCLRILREPTPIGNSFMVYPFHAGAKDTTELLMGTHIVPAPPVGHENRLRVAAIHAPVGPEDAPWMQSYKSVPTNGFDVALFSDIHTAFGPYKNKSGCVVANPGCLNKLSISDIGKPTQIALVQSTSRIRYLGVASPPDSELFDLTKIRDTKDKAKQSLLAGIEAAKLAKGIDLEQHVRKVAETIKAKPSLVRLLLQELNDVRRNTSEG